MMKNQLDATLVELARLGCLSQPRDLSGQQLGESLEISQQSASRRLIALEDASLIRREMGVRRHRIQITDVGRQQLEFLREELSLLLKEAQEIRFSGQLEAGLGEGQYYLGREGYMRAFESALGWRPYPGTFNLKLDSTSVKRIQYLRSHPKFTIPGFEAEGRTFGGVLCSPAKIGKMNCAAILPLRTHHTEVLEIIAPVRLRSALPAGDGDKFECTVELGGEK